MRKVAYIIGTICAVLSLVAAVLKLTGTVGGGILFVLFTPLFSIAAMPLYLYSVGKAETERVMHFALRLCGYSFAALQVGLLFYAQRWPGSKEMIYAGLAGQIAFAIVFLANIRKPEVKTKGFSMFAVLAMLILLSLVLGCYDRTKDSEEEKQQFEAYETMRSNYFIVLEHSNQLLQDTGSDTVFTNDSVNIALLTIGLELQDYIQNIKDEVVSHSNFGLSASVDEPEKIVHPLDYDTPTQFMVGSDPASPTGKGLELYDRLLAFKTDILPPTVNFAVPVRDDSEMRVQWVKDNFYHATVLETLTRLTKIQTEVCASINAAVETNTNE